MPLSLRLDARISDGTGGMPGLPARSAIDIERAQAGEIHHRLSQPGAGLPPSGRAGRGGLGQQGVEVEIELKPFALADVTGCADRLALPSSAKLLAFSEPASVPLRRLRRGRRAARTASASGLSCLSCRFGLRARARRRLSADFAGCRPRSARAACRPARGPSCCSRTGLCRQGDGLETAARRAALEAGVYRQAFAAQRQPALQRGLPASLVPATSSCGLSRSSASASAALALIRNSSASTRRACLAGSGEGGVASVPPAIWISRRYSA